MGSQFVLDYIAVPRSLIRLEPLLLIRPREWGLHFNLDSAESRNWTMNRETELWAYCIRKAEETFMHIAKLQETKKAFKD